MELNEKKKILEQLALISKYNGCYVYILINRNFLDHIIEELLLENDLNKDKKFVNALCELSYYFENSFPSLCNSEIYLSLLLEYKIPRFLLSHRELDSSRFSHKYDYDMKKLFVENMYENIKFIYKDYEDFFKKLNIRSNMSLRVKGNVDILFRFMVDLVWCNYNEYSLLYIFQNYKVSIYELNQTKSDFVWNHYFNGWNKLIYNYTKKIDAVLQITNKERS